jgi:small subunit ribosomal protein S5
MNKAVLRGHKDMHRGNRMGTTIAHEVVGSCGGAKVLLKPASPGTGVIAAGGVRAVLEAAGIRDILPKSLGSSNVLNVVQATFQALDQLKNPEEEAARRGKDVKDVTPFWERRK